MGGGRRATVNHAFLEVERNFLLPSGLPGRSWFGHAFHAPRVYTGYEAAIFSRVCEATERKDWAARAKQLGAVQAAIDRGTASRGRALQSLSGASDLAGGSPRFPSDAGQDTTCR